MTEGRRRLHAYDRSKHVGLSCRLDLRLRCGQSSEMKSHACQESLNVNITVPQTDTGRVVRVSKAREIMMLKELANWPRNFGRRGAI